MHFIEARDLTHTYTVETEDAKIEEVALDGINLAVDSGEFVAIIGMNGSGKSTLAKHFNGLLLPTKGRVLVDNMDTNKGDELWKIRQKVSMVFQNPDNQIIAAIVEDDIAFGPENLGIPPEEIRKRIDEALEALNISHLKHMAPHLLSGGQKQLVAIAGALAMRTNCIVFDEPTAMLDPQGRKLVMEAIKYLHREFKMTIILITHFMEEALMADRIVVMEKGKIVMEDKPVLIFHHREKLKSLGLSIPLAMDFAYLLKKENYHLQGNITTNEKLAKSIYKYIKGDRDGN